MTLDRNARPKPGTVYRRTTDGQRLRYAGEPSAEETHRTGYVGWCSNGPAVFGRLVGQAWGWPWAYEIDEDQSWDDSWRELARESSSNG